MEFLTIIDVINLMGIETPLPLTHFSNMKSQGKLDGFPNPLITKVDRKQVFSKDRVIEWMNRAQKPPINLTLEFLKGTYAHPRLKSKWEARKMVARVNRPRTTTVKCLGEWNENRRIK